MERSIRIWISVRSIQAKALYFETLLTDYGALFGKLPLSAFVWKEDYDKDNQLPLDVLELWDVLTITLQL